MAKELIGLSRISRDPTDEETAAIADDILRLIEASERRQKRARNRPIAPTLRDEGL